MATFSARDLALHAARLCQDKGGSDLRVLAMPPGAAVCDYVVIVSGRSDRQTYAIVEEVYHFCKRHKVHHCPVEGETGWMLIDCFEVVVHALGVEQREHYALDTLWKNAREVDFEAALKNLPDPDHPNGKPATTEASASSVVSPPIGPDAFDESDELEVEKAVEEGSSPAPRRPRKSAAAPVKKRTVEKAPAAVPRSRGRAAKATATGKSKKAAADE